MSGVHFQMRIGEEIQRREKEQRIAQIYTDISYYGKLDTIKELMSYPKCRSVTVINNPARPGSNHREVNCINYN